MQYGGMMSLAKVLILIITPHQHEIWIEIIQCSSGFFPSKPTRAARWRVADAVP